MTESINKLLTIELDIAHLYNLLLNLDIEGQRKLTSYIVTLNALKNTIIDEDRLMNSLTIEELNILSNNDKLEELLKEKQINLDITINDIIERISKRVVNIILISQVLKNNNTKILGDILLSERIDIFLSYLDEIIETSPNKKELILFKYKYIFVLQSIDEKRIVERNFATDKTIYLPSLMYFQILKIKTSIYKTYKDAMAKGILDEMINEIKNNNNLNFQ